MPKILYQGSFRHRLRSFAALMRIGFVVTIRHALGKRLVQEWSRDFEIGNLFWRGQFDHALTRADIAEGRAYFDSLQTLTDEMFDVDIRPTNPNEPKGDWFQPRKNRSSTTMLYFHGGGYSFYAGISRRMIEMLAHHLGIAIFAPDYRLTPEHPHPAQIEDAVASYRFLLARNIDPAEIVIAGDSAGGHLALMTLLALRETGLPQPTLAIGLCPWTDIGARGASMTANDKYDLVQGYMALKFGEWLQGDSGFTRERLSPIDQDYRGLAPLYLQGGGKEMLIDMIRDFAAVARDHGADVMLDVWEHMTHDFQANGRTLPESAEALDRIAAAISARVEPGASPLAACARTVICSQTRS